MRRTIIFAGTLALLLTESAFAQSRLPRNNPVEQQVIESNRSIQRRQGIVSDQQQTQFEINQLRQSHSREQVFSPPIGGFCGAGQVGC